MNALQYPVVIEPLSDADGGGFAAIVPDLPGCMSDGETPQQAVSNVTDAIVDWIETAQRAGRDIPRPSKHLALA